MKKLLTLIAVIGTMTAPAKAQEQNAPSGVQPFIGLEIAKDSVGLSEYWDGIVADEANSFSVSFGFRTKSQIPVGLSVFYQQSSEEDQLLGYFLTGKPATTTAKFKAFGFDGNVYAPLANRLYLTGSLGVGFYTFDVNSSWGRSTSGDFTGFRAGLGFEYQIADKFAVNAGFRYVGLINNDEYSYDSVENLKEATIGVKLYF